MLVQVSAHKTIRQQIITPDLLDPYFLVNRKLFGFGVNKFSAKVFGQLLGQHVMVYPFFGDESCLATILSNEQQQLKISQHFMQILLILETKKITVDDKDLDDEQMLVWFATNINFLYYQEILAFQQLQFLKKIFTYKTINKALIMEEYLKCIKISHNKRNLLPQEQQKFETNAALTIILGYLIATQITELPKMDMLEKIVSQFGFRNELERTTVFNNTMQILFDLPTMNYYFLNYLKVRCDNNHQEFLQNYLAHLSTAQTVSFDKYMLTLQLSVLFGQIDAYMQQIQVEMAKQFQDFLNFKNLIKRRLIILVDILENPFYCMNVLCHAQVDFPGKQELEQKIFKDAAICILRFNELMTFQQLEDILKLFVYIQGIPQYIKDLVEQSPDGKIKLKDQYSQNWPYMILQKDLISVFQYLQKIEDPFEELLNSSPFFPFLFDIRAKLFLSEPFIEMVKLILGSPYRMELYVWIGKLLYYGKQQLLKKGASLFETLLATAECQSFIQSQEEKHPKLVQYLRS